MTLPVQSDAQVSGSELAHLMFRTLRRSGVRRAVERRPAVPVARAPRGAPADRMLEVLRDVGEVGATTFELQRAGVRNPRSVLPALQARGCMLLSEEIQRVYGPVVRWWLLVDGSPTLF